MKQKCTAPPSSPLHAAHMRRARHARRARRMPGLRPVRRVRARATHAARAPRVKRATRATCAAGAAGAACPRCWAMPRGAGASAARTREAVRRDQGPEYSVPQITGPTPPAATTHLRHRTAIRRVGCGEDARAERTRGHEHPLRAQRAPALLANTTRRAGPPPPHQHASAEQPDPQTPSANLVASRQYGSRRRCPGPSDFAPAKSRAPWGDPSPRTAKRARRRSPHGGRSRPSERDGSRSATASGSGSPVTRSRRRARGRSAGTWCGAKYADPIAKGPPGEPDEPQDQPECRSMRSLRPVVAPQTLPRIMNEMTSE